MRNFLSMCSFHLRLYVKNSYFLWLPIRCTISFFLLQYIAAFASGSLDDPNIWLRAGVFGLWASATTAAGSISYQRYQGTLPYLLNNTVGDKVSLAALLIPASTFGLVSFPLAWLCAAVAGLHPSGLCVRQLAGILCLWLSAVVLDFAIAGFFVLSRNASIYEELIFIPLLLLSGFLGVPSWMEGILTCFGWILPLAPASRLILQATDTSWLAAAQYGTGMIVWGCVAYVLSDWLLRKARQRGEISIL